MSDEKLKILQMIADGKISPEQGADLLKAVQEEEPDTRTGGSARWVVVKVHEPDTGKVHVNVRLPIRFASKFLKFTNRISHDADIDIEEVIEAIKEGSPGKVCEVDTEDGIRVDIWLEE